MTRNSTAIRDWLNVIAAVGAFLVGVVSFWTTARISGLEDYLRSEIGRRNSELGALTVRTERAQALAEQRAEALAGLQFSADELTASYASTQAKLEDARGQLVGLQERAVAFQTELSNLKGQSAAQVDRLDLLNRRRVFQSVTLMVLSNIMFRSKDTPMGESAYRLVVTRTPAADENDLIPMYKQMREAAALTCAGLKEFSPEMPDEVADYPKYPFPPGARVKGSPGSFLMTPEQKDTWEKAVKDWSKAWEETSRAKRAASDYKFQLQSYAADWARQCTCAALATSDHPTTEICPGVLTPTLPRRSTAKEAA